MTSPTPLVDTLVIGNDLIELKDFAQQQCELLCGSESLQNKTVQRRFTKNRQYFVHNFLIDSLREFGYYFESKYSKPTAKTIRLERIQNVYFKNMLEYTAKDIQKIGKEVNEYLLTLLQKENYYTLLMKDSMLNSFRKRCIPESPNMLNDDTLKDLM